MAYPFLALFLAVITTPLCIILARRFGLYDLPDSQRKTHEWKIPYTGGLSIVFSVSATVLVMWLVEGVGFFTESFSSFIPLYLYTVEATIIIVVLGLYDDLKELTYFQKFFFQFIAAFLMILGAIKSDLFPQVFSIVNTGVLMNSFGMVVSVLWIVGTTNAINMIDGMDGLAAGTSIISAVALAVVAFIWGHAIIGIILLTLAGSLTGFLVFNSYPAKIFMGDGGSMFVGFILAVCGWVLVGSSPLSFISMTIPIIILGLPVSDTLLAFFRRIVKGKNPFSADLFHIHHLLKDRFRFSLRQNVYTLYAISLIYACVGLLVTVVPQTVGWVLISILVLSNIFFLHKLGYTKLIRGKETPKVIDLFGGNLGTSPLAPHTNGKNGNGTSKSHPSKIDFTSH